MAHPSIRDDLAELLKLAGPVVVSRLGLMAMGLTDVVIVGRYSATQLGYHAIAWGVTTVILTAVIGLQVGVQVMTSRAVGEGRKDKTGAVLRRGVAYGFWLGLASMTALLVAGPSLMQALRLSAELTQGATTVLRVFALCLPFYAVGVAATFWLEGHGRPGPAAVTIWVANAVNLAVGLVLVPGAFGLPALGAVGAATATWFAQGFMAVVMFAYIARMPEARAWGVFDKPKRDRQAERLQRQVGYGAGASNTFETAAFAGMNVIAGWISALSVAAWAVVINVAAILFMVPLGLATAGGVLVGRAYGARDVAGIWRAGLVVFGTTTAFGAVAALTVWPAAPLLVRAYLSDPAAVALAAPAMAMIGLFVVPDALQVVTSQALRARGDVFVPSCTHLVSYVLLMLPLAWWLAIPMGLGLPGILWAVVAASFLAASLLLGRFWMLGRRLNPS